ncbi:beta-methylgalactoside transporter inner membrane component [Pelotomaculum schinkii]|uniref:Beta-methylgalactoside transporter inner membrane component n=1 Tax=Pelotomaculum schinkii TaxID=78350 RepID=A0A4Y7REE3_9FIRM|nr:ABC transporter permease [Pelotomaculum schinkii]TEB07141.1 beta-methylgalactoside transporter inner membrane component [Pelotomaculum schinkii]
MSLTVFQGSIELGIIYAIMALGVFISFRTLNIPDLTVDGSFVLGAAISAVMCTNSNPFTGLLLAFVAGCGAGCITALLHTKLKIQPLLAGILTMLALYSVNLKVMHGKANIPLINMATIFSSFEGFLLNDYTKIVISFGILLVILVILFLFLKTKLGFVLRATGDNDQMVRALGVNTDFTILVGLAISNGLVALSGSIIAQYQSFTDISMGTGMVIIGLASVIVGEVIFGTKTLLKRLIAVILGSIIYRLVIAFALELGMPTTDLKLVSAVIVALALSMSTIKDGFEVMKKRLDARS